MTKEELKTLIGQAELNKAVVDLVAFIVTNRSAVDAAIATANSKIATLQGSDTGKSVRTIANEELATQLIPANAQEALDTLQEIAAWIQSHPGDASAMNTAITNLQTLVGSLPESGTEATTVIGYIDEQIAAVSALISGKNVSASGETGEGALISASASNNAVSVESTQRLKDAVALAESALQSVKTINGGAVSGNGDIDLPAKLEVNDIAALTGAQIEALRAGDVVIKNDASGKHAYKVSYKGSTGICLTYADCENVETIAYEKVDGTWTYDSKDVTAIGTALHLSDFDTIGTAAAASIVAAAIAAATTPAEQGE